MELREGFRQKGDVRVVGIGGAGVAMVNTMIEAGMSGVVFIAAGTDFENLERSLAPGKVGIGANHTGGLGAGADPNAGFKAALESRRELITAVQGAVLLFIVAGMGGGTGTGAAPVVAEIAAQMGVTTVAVVTMPFVFEGRRRRRQASEGAAELRRLADVMVTVECQSLTRALDRTMTLEAAYRLAAASVAGAVKILSEFMTTPGLVSIETPTRVSLACASLEDANLTRANLRGVDLSGACLRRTNLAGADLEGALLVTASLQGANLANANLRGAHLRGADMRGASVEGAVFEDADLRHARLSDASGFTQVQCDSARTDEVTALPIGITRNQESEDGP